MVSEYEKLRALNVQKNTELLKSLGLDKPLFEPKEKPHKAKTIVKKRKATADVEEAAPEVAKTPRLESAPRNASVRRSARNAGKKVDYTAEQQSSVPLALAYTSGVKSLENDADLLREEKTVRTHDPKTFGAIPGIEVGSWWETRQACSKDAVHAPWVAGISGGPDGAYSVALSGGYDDDVDLGYAFTYTGSGWLQFATYGDLQFMIIQVGGISREQKIRRKIFEPLHKAQTSHLKTLFGFNKALKRSSETGNPVRVIRGFKLKSPYAPSEGYRYDGLYTVEKAWMEKGLNKKAYLVCKYAFKRIPGQPPLPVRDDTEGKETVKEALPDTAAAS